jgi:hypothetical protein
VQIVGWAGVGFEVMVSLVLIFVLTCTSKRYHVRIHSPVFLGLVCTGALMHACSYIPILLLYTAHQFTPPSAMLWDVSCPVHR